ncbi:pilus assembly protein TadG-related protein [Humisphaera borealis]|uniref:Putative Flp pilus-assembly TadG-like N-terminal domain-containing protein n=1 Tax=Humisphaera borealis TaxID=2807512 RepID=A0A7M2X4W2_9BACT|nr:pilus assembly protein TadG-related protein [Humisphaera borealis]QOV91820.1 hypothetical protein IPV69_10885 [Humisphaera borealis]
MDVRAARFLRRRSGAFVLIYVTFAMPVLLAIASLAVDWGHVVLVKTELSRLSDAAARAAAGQMDNGAIAARNAAKLVAQYNPIDGATFTLTDDDIVFGTWSAGVFSAVPDDSFSSATAVRITAARSTARSSPIPMFFAGSVGQGPIEVTCSTVATRGSASNTGTATVTGKANVWFAGLPSNATCAKGGYVDTNTNCPAVQFNGFPISSGSSLQLSATGSLSNVPTGGSPLDGGSWTADNQTNNLGGKSNATLPANALIGVFLSNDDPTATPAPPDLNFSSAGSRNYTSLSPLLKQVFFIGDGKANGVQQTIVAPNGATRLFFGSYDNYGWSNNSGSATITVNSVGGSVSIVK